MSKFLIDFPSGPLDYYRKKASFDWRSLKTFLYTEESLEYSNNLHEEILKNPILYSQTEEPLTVDKKRELASKRTFILSKLESFSFKTVQSNLHYPTIMQNTLCQLDTCVDAKYSIAFTVFPIVIQALGTQRHFHYLESANIGDIMGAYCITEFGHGSNAKNIQTTARYVKDTEEFILHTPNFEAAKCWSGLLGQLATHAIVYAHLITPDGVNHSLHAFVVKIRNPATLLPYPGITLGDMGEKNGLNGLDNGFLMFNQYRIPRINLLNKTGDVSKDGKYITSIDNKNKWYTSALTFERVYTITLCGNLLSQGITIAVRYAAVRKQFGPEGDEEVPVLEYQSLQYRLIPYLSLTYLLNMFSNYLLMFEYQFLQDITFKRDVEKLTQLQIELHNISSGAKAVASWVGRNGLQEFREVCGGHGYLKASGLGELIHVMDSVCTIAGDNHVMIQQTSNWLLKFWPLILQDKYFSSPMKSVNFLVNTKEILKNKFTLHSIEELEELKNILSIYQWLVCYLLKFSYEKQDNLIKKEKLNMFWARNENQIYYSKSLVIVFIEHFMIQQTLSIISEANDPKIKCVLTKLLSLYGVWSLEKHISRFYEGGYAIDPSFANLIQKSVLKLCAELKDDAVSLVDVIAPPDFLMKSVLGRSDGLVYKHLKAALLQNPTTFCRPKWWTEIV